MKYESNLQDQRKEKKNSDVMVSWISTHDVLIRNDQHEIILKHSSTILTKIIRSDMSTILAKMAKI